MSKKAKKAAKSKTKKLAPQAGLAIKNQFYLEATWIISTIMEKKLHSVISLVDPQAQDVGLNLEKKIKRCKQLHSNGKYPLLEKHFELKFFDDLRNWKNYRNGVFKDMTDVHVSKERFKKMSEEGLGLLHDLATSAKGFKTDWKHKTPEAPGPNDSTDEPQG